MSLPEDDELFLNGLGCPWEMLPDPAGGAYVVLNSFDVSGANLNPPSTKLMVRIPQGYPMAQLDMWYCSPPIRIGGGGYPAQADVFEMHMGEKWQRFSRHLPAGCWKPGLDGLRSFFRFIFKELQGKDGRP